MTICLSDTLLPVQVGQAVCENYSVLLAVAGPSDEGLQPGGDVVGAASQEAGGSAKEAGALGLSAREAPAAAGLGEDNEEASRLERARFHQCVPGEPSLPETACWS